MLLLIVFIQRDNVIFCFSIRCVLCSMKTEQFVHSEYSRCFAEATGTYFLVLTVGCNVMVMQAAGALSIGAMLMCMIFALGSVSGAHFNPAVTLAVYLSGRGCIGGRRMLYYMGAQCLGALVAGLCYEVIFQTAFVLKPVGRYSVPMVMAVEVIYTMALCYVVLNVATTKAQAGNHYFGLAIGFTVVSAAVAIGQISNCCLNPAVALGSFIAALVAHGKNAFGDYTIYFFMPFFGSLFGTLAFYLVRRKDEYDPINVGLLMVNSDAKPADDSPVKYHTPALRAVPMTNSDDDN